MAIGRPREFDYDDALDRALETFWKYGFEGATIPALTAAMGINRPSLYAAFGNKEELFRKALDRYAESSAAYVRESLNEPTAYAVVQRMLKGAIDLVTNPKKPKGCFAVQAALASSQENDAVRRELVKRRVEAREALRERFQRAIREGDLPRNADCATLALYVVTVMHGMAVQAASGAKHEELLRVAEMAMRAWPI